MVIKVKVTFGNVGAASSITSANDGIKNEENLP
jgi:hypothetical protein